MNRLLPTVAALTAVLLVTGCAAQAPVAPTASEDGVTTLRVSTLGFCDDPVTWGVDQGVFAEHGLELKLTTVQSGAAGVAALQAGDLDVVYVNPLTSLQAIGSGVPLRIVSGSVLSNAESNAVVVAGDSGVTTPAQLDGATLALNSLGGLPEFVTAAWLASAGGGAEAEFVAIPFADQIGSVVNGTVDAAQVGATQLAAPVADGSVRVLGNPYFDGLGSIPTAFYVADAAFVEQHEAALAAFAEAMTEVAASANDDAQDAARFAVTSRTCGVAAADLEGSAESTYTGRLDFAAVEALVALLVERGAIAQPDLDTILPEWARA